MKKVFLLATMMLGLITLNYAQENYAVLITGDYAGKNIPANEQYNNGQGKSAYGFDEFWNDTFLMWDMLTRPVEEGGKGYSEENVFVLFADGVDYYKVDLNYDGHYKPSDSISTPSVTDYAATIGNVQLVFNQLAQTITPNDFLFVWTFDHGGTSGGGNSTLHLIDGTMTDAAFANLVNPINAHKKVFWMQQCFAGGFADNLTANNTFFHSASQPNQTAYRADDETKTHQSVIENEVRSGRIYHHGEFNFHTYSVTNGASPANFTNYFGEPYTDADTQSAYQGNNDGVISMKESSEWEKLHESEPGTPLVDDPGNIGAYTSLEYPTLIWKNVVTNKTARGIIGVTKDVHVTAGHTLTFKSLSKVTFLNNAKLIVDEGATLVIEPGAKFYNGDMEIYMSSTPFEISQVYFESTKINCTTESLRINDCEFKSCGEIISHNKGGEVKNNKFLASHLSFKAPLLFSQNSASAPNIAVFENKFTESNNCVHKAIITLENYVGFIVKDNYIDGSKGNGINIVNSGKKEIRTIIITNNQIHDCDLAAIQCYNSASRIYNNTIFNNQYGIKLLNNSSTSLSGNQDADYEEETQVIRDNDSYEIYASANAYPWYMRYNVIRDHDNGGNSATPSDPIFYYDVNGMIRIRDARYNCWGSNFDKEDDIYPHQYINITPTWCPSNEIYDDNNIALATYQEGVDNFESENYAEAEVNFKTVIQDYPNSIYAADAMKMLLNLTRKYNQNYASLMTYYNDNTNIQQDVDLKKLAEKLTIECEVALKNYPTAIAYYENVIANPETNTNDSIFAVIDLGRTYEIMEADNDKSNYVGKMPELKPVSHKAYIENREKLLASIPRVNSQGNVPSNQNTIKNEGELLQNVPNPTKGITTIGYQLENDVREVSIVIYDYTGKTIQRIDGLSHTAGKNSVKINLSQLRANTYFYSLFVNGHKSDTKKLVLIH